MIFIALFFYILLGLILPLILLIYVIYSLIAEIKGSPFVPTSGKIVREILEKAKLKKGQEFIELGSGDGRVTRMAVREFGVKGLGIDLNPYLVFYSRMVSRFLKLNDIEFKTRNLFNLDLSSADIVFLFLVPRTLKKLREKLLKECKKNTLIISHGFKVEGWEKYLVGEIERKTFSTYYYKIK